MLRFALATALCLLAQPALAGSTPAPPNAKVFFVNLKDGAKIHSPFVVKLGISGMKLVPSGNDTPNSGHHHLYIDVAAASGDFSTPIPADKHHLHLGKAQTKVTLRLSPGKHTLQLVLGDAKHIPHKPPVVSERITVTVVK